MQGVVSNTERGNLTCMRDFKVKNSREKIWWESCSGAVFSGVEGA